MEKLQLTRHELLISRTIKLNYPGFVGLDHKTTTREGFVAFQLRCLHSWAAAPITAIRMHVEDSWGSAKEFMWDTREFVWEC